MKIRFLKKLAKNIFYLLGYAGTMYTFYYLGERYYDDGAIGILTFLAFILVLLLTGVSWKEALFDEKWEKPTFKED